MPGDPSGPPARPRRSTLERFNDELAILDRPLESEIEYYDEPRPSRWPRVMAATAGLLLLAGLGFLLGGPSAEEAVAAAAPTVTEAVPPRVVAPSIEPLPPAPLPAMPSPTELVAGAPEESTEAAEATDVAAPRLRPTVAAWAKVGRAGGSGPARTKIVSRRGR